MAITLYMECMPLLFYARQVVVVCHLVTGVPNWVA